MGLISILATPQPAPPEFRKTDINETVKELPDGTRLIDQYQSHGYPNWKPLSERQKLIEFHRLRAFFEEVA